MPTPLHPHRKKPSPPLFLRSHCQIHAPNGRSPSARAYSSITNPMTMTKTKKTMLKTLPSPLPPMTRKMMMTMLPITTMTLCSTFVTIRSFLMAVVFGSLTSPLLFIVLSTAVILLSLPLLSPIELEFMQVLRFEIGASQIAFQFLEYLIQFRADGENILLTSEPLK
ncbi:hypothetical protein IHE45_08G036200 [Dioscorea alata]|uniref:Uncharacterized protein n=1 Tax=Dioscorea alata TaxID=55571 RepID=A0ACB7VIF1_DIOAL|nr:hypothetical protein IHE45_08G036200 [Dioscorea alata]